MDPLHEQPRAILPAGVDGPNLQHGLHGRREKLLLVHIDARGRELRLLLVEPLPEDLTLAQLGSYELVAAFRRRRADVGDPERIEGGTTAATTAAGAATSGRGCHRRLRRRPHALERSVARRLRAQPRADRLRRCFKSEHCALVRLELHKHRGAEALDYLPPVNNRGKDGTQTTRASEYSGVLDHEA